MIPMEISILTTQWYVRFNHFFAVYAEVCRSLLIHLDIVFRRQKINPNHLGLTPAASVAATIPVLALKSSLVDTSTEWWQVCSASLLLRCWCLYQSKNAQSHWQGSTTL